MPRNRTKKSIREIYAQLGRIGDMGNAATNNRFYQTERGRRARSIAERYARNMENQPGVLQIRNGMRFVDDERRVSRRVYMGLTAS